MRREPKARAGNSVSFSPLLGKSDAEVRNHFASLLSPSTHADEDQGGTPWQEVVSKDAQKKKAAKDKRKREEAEEQRRKRVEEQQQQNAKAILQQQQQLAAHMHAQQQLMQQGGQPPLHYRQQQQHAHAQGQQAQHNPQQQGWARQQQHQPHNTTTSQWGGQQAIDISMHAQQQQAGGALQNHFVSGGQMQPWGQQAAAPTQPPFGQQQPAWGKQGQAKGNKPVMLDGEQVMPAVVVFGEGSKPALKQLLASVAPAAASAVVSIHKITTGAPRCVLHCKSSNMQIVHSLVAALSGQTRAAIYEDRSPFPGASPKAKQAANGLAKATTTAGVCRYFASGERCPHLDRNGRCNFICYCGPPSRN
jgi:membrane-associated HD superfamily phosphohydrolase